MRRPCNIDSSQMVSPRCVLSDVFSGEDTFHGTDVVCIVNIGCIKLPFITQIIIIKTLVEFLNWYNMEIFCHQS